MSTSQLTEPNDAEEYCNRASEFYKKGDYDKTIADCNQAILLDPNFANAYDSRGTAYSKKAIMTRQ